MLSASADEHLVITLANQAAVALENSRLHEETMHQIKRLEALHAIDQSIAGTFDQRSTLDVLLTHTLDQLERMRRSSFCWSLTSKLCNILSAKAFIPNSLRLPT